MFKYLSAYVCLHLVVNKSKFDARDENVSLLEYPIRVKGYNLYDLETHFIFICGDVSFHKIAFPIKQKTEQDNTQALATPAIDFVNHLYHHGPYTHECSCDSSTQLSSTNINPSFRAFPRQHRILGYLKDYHCHFAKCADNSLSTIKGPTHPYDISKFL